MAKTGKKGLKAALSSQQSRLKAKDKATQAAKVREKPSQPGLSAKAKGKIKLVPKPSTMPFNTSDKILLIGEGNFSFATALFKHPSLEFLPPRNVTATAYDSEKECYEKYPEAGAIVKDLKEKGVEIVFGVDATRLEKCKALKGRKFDRVVWNFPHAGKGITDQDRNILSNQMLLLDFFRSVSGYLTDGPVPAVHKKKVKRTSQSDDEEDAQGSDVEDEGQESSQLGRGRAACRGTVLVTLRNVPPYTEWNLPKLAKHPPPPNPPYTVLRSFAFQRSDWEGYEHAMTKGERAHGTGRTGLGGEDRTWEFCLKD
ncbi:hypothetical protein BD410DRAFT_771940 [Rickenella mellea]|uniref:25S rRNA (uridine-N(3))-methyltransferase BMT5-like domain-containing protein n=1 Tax=Rickenella mellea TaxID=50990 RepID=A0A4Y7Q204_9AGAM|nr:hypothetical protein BD410DRAFT_771940 [Rickenella mellea]